MGVISREVEETYFAQFANLRDLVVPFLNAGFDITWARQRFAYNTTLHVFFLLPQDHIRESYGFDAEVLLAYTPYDHMEPRTIQAINTVFLDSPARGRVDSLNYFMISQDVAVRQWLDAYRMTQQESRIIVAFTDKELRENKADAWFVRNRLNEQFFGRDLFSNSLPLTEDTYFFGRQSLVARYHDAIRRSENR